MNAPLRVAHAPGRQSPATAQSQVAVCWRRALVLLALLLAMLASPAHGDSAEALAENPPDAVLDSSAAPATANWVVLGASGSAAWRPQGDVRWRDFARGEVLPAGCEIETGRDGEVILVAGGDQLIVAPLGRLVVPFARPGQDRRLRHERGHILVQIESRAARDVRVDTPLLSLGIKGTMFEVEVEPEQDSVLVHDGEVEVTTPDERDAVDLGAGEGLRQPSAAGSRAVPFTVPELETPSPSGERTWHLPAPEDSALQEAEAPRLSTPADGTTSRAQAGQAPRRIERAAPSRSRSARSFGWLDELASSWAVLAIAGVALLILLIPVLAFLQNLRAQWLDRPATKGRRRRQLIRG